MANYTNAISRVRLLTSDLSEPPLIADDVLEGFLSMHDWDQFEADVFTKQMVWRASADALDAMATSEVLLSKKIRTQDLTTDGVAVAAELRKQAATLRGKADAEDEAEGSFFDIIPLNRGNRHEGEELRLP